MSIVYDYLKQIQRQEGPAAVVAGQEGSREKREWQLPVSAIGVWVLVGVVVLGAAYVIVPRVTGPVAEGIYRSRTKSAVRVSFPSAGYVLEGIIYNPDHPFAIINGQMLEQNGRIDDFVVTSITPNTVSLKNAKDNTGRTLQL